MTCAEFKEEAAALALSSLEEGEAKLARAHLQQPAPHEGCPEIYQQAREVTLQLADAIAPKQVSEATWKRIEASVAKGSAFKVREALAWGLAVAAVLIAFLVHRTESRTAEEMARSMRAQSDAVKMLSMPENRTLAFLPQGHQQGTASLVFNPKEKRAFVISAAFHPAQGQELELWVIRGKNPPVPAGMMHRMPDGMMMGEVKPELIAQNMPDAVAISLEPAGGRPTPTEVIWVAPVKG